MKRGLHISEMDGLRGLLALWVFLSHILCWCGAVDLGWRLPDSVRGAWYAFIYAHGAVDAFMILSGFAVAFLVSKFEGQYTRFMLNRVFRIYPVYLVCLVLGVLASQVAPAVLDGVAWHNTQYFVNLRSFAESERSAGMTHLLLHLSLLNGLVPRELLSNATATFLPPAWSITLEWQYYLLAPMIAVAMRSVRGLAWLIACCLIGEWVGKYWLNTHLAFLPSQLPMFLLGVASQRVFLARQAGRGLEPRLLLQVALGLSGLALLAQWRPAAMVVWIVVFATILRPNEAPKYLLLTGVQRLLQGRVPQFLGRISFPLYLVHWPAIVMLLWLLQQLLPTAGRGVALLWLSAVGIPLVLALSTGLHRWVEAPGIAFGRELIAKRARSAVGEA